jgi:hypothetical protein
LAGLLIVVFILLCELWVVVYMAPEARLLRASKAVMRLVEKRAEESPVALGLAATRLGDWLAPEAELAVDGEFQQWMQGRRAIVQLFTQIRAHTEELVFLRPDISLLADEKGRITTHMDATYRWITGGLRIYGEGEARLHWNKGEKGWLIEQVELHILQTDVFDWGSP